MPTVSGSIYYDPARSADSGGALGLASIPVVLQDTATMLRQIVLTDADGAYSFLNVPAGSYRIVEAFGQAGGVPTPADFNVAAVGAVPIAAVPPLSVVAASPTGATNLDCVTPSTIFVTVAAADVTAQNVFNGPVAYLPLSLALDPCCTVFPANLVTDADGGSFGTFPTGTPANSGTPTNPYPAISPDFNYVAPDPSTYTPIDGEFTIQNTMNDAMSNVIGAWWRISDRSTGNETGRMMVVNEDSPGGIIFRTTAAVSPNQTYLFSTWILNLFRVEGYPGPEFAVRILDEGGNPLYESALGAEIPVSELYPVWREIGGVINSRSNSQLVIEFFSEGEAAVGNDFAIDDIGLREILLPEFELVKTESQETATVGDVVTYGLRLENTCAQPLTDALLRDVLPAGLAFVSDSVVINGVSYPAANPLAGFLVPDILGGTTLEVSFQAQVTEVPAENPAVNRATLQYVYTPVPNGIEDVYSVNSNPVALLIAAAAGEADLAIAKTANCRCVLPCQSVAYSITVRNLGPSAAEDVMVRDCIPAALTQAMFSLNGGNWQPWSGSYSLPSLAAGASVTLRLRATVAWNACGVIRNTAHVTAATADPNPNNNIAGVAVQIGNGGRGCGCRPSCC